MVTCGYFGHMLMLWVPYLGSEVKTTHPGLGLGGNLSPNTGSWRGVLTLPPGSPDKWRSLVQTELK